MKTKFIWVRNLLQMSLPGISGIVMDLLRQDYSLPDILLTMESV